MSDLLDKYFSNLLSEEDKRELFQTLDKDEQLRKEYTERLHALSLVMTREKRGDALYAQRKLRQFKQKQQSLFWNKVSLQFVKYAAVVILAVGGLLTYQYVHNERAPIEYVNIEVPNGQRTQVFLPDGTAVWLNAGTSLAYPTNFSSRHRDIYLQGEAYLEVKSDKKNPFIVRTDRMNVKVLGTKFNVKSYKDETAYVTLLEGRVEVITADEVNSLTLKPNEQISISETNTMLLTQVESTHVNMWTLGELVYVNEPLSVIVKDLERRFDVRISILDEDLSEDLFTSRIDSKAHIDQALSRLKGTRELDYVIEENEIKIFKLKTNMPMRK